MATAEEIRAAIQAGPQTQDALDQAFATYTPAQLAAAFPEYGSESDYATASAAAKDRAASAAVAGPGNDNFVPPPGTTKQGYSREYTAEQLAGIRRAWNESRNDPAKLMQAMKDTGVTVKDIALASAGSGDAETLQAYNNYFVQAGAPVGFGGMYTSADMTANDKAYIDYMLAQPNGTGGTLADTYKAQKIDPYNNAGVIAQAKSQNERADRRNDLYTQSGQPMPMQYDQSGTSAGVSPWTNPTWQAAQAAAAKALANRQAAQTAASPNVVAGPGGLLPVTGTAPSGLLTGTPVPLPIDTGRPVPPPTGTGGLLTGGSVTPPGQTGNVSTFGGTSIPTGNANQYSRQYTPSQLAGIKDWWSKTYNNRGQAIADMDAYSVSTQDLAMATNQPYQQLANYLKEGGAPVGFGGAIEGAGGLFKRAEDLAQQPGIQFCTTQGLLSDPTSQLARNILARDTQYQQTAPVMGSGRWGLPSIAPGAGLLAPDYWLAAKTAEAQRTAAAANQPPPDPYASNGGG
jgi:hypothetical protein